MAGFWANSLSQISNKNGLPYIGAKAFFYSGGTTTPITTYRDNDLSTPHPNPLETDGNGVFPAVFLDEADVFYRVRVTTAGGVVLYDTPAIPIIGPSGSGGGAPTTPVDPNAIYATGDMMVRYGSEVRAGFVRLNGRSIGSATSGSSERANSDTQVLYEYLWNTDPSIEITGGRGGSSSSDFSSNKPLVLPDWRGRALVGLDTMGNIAAGRLTDAITLGWAGGLQTHTLTSAQIPSHSHTVTDPGHNHRTTYDTPLRQGDSDRGSSGSIFSLDQFAAEQLVTTSTTGITLGSTGGGESHNNVQPSKACSVYMRL